jgi:aldose 1-epimerase
MTDRTVTIASPDGETSAQFVPTANLVCCSLRHRGGELLHIGEGVAAYAQRGKTMGIPLLYPWANRLSAPEYTVAGVTVALGPPEGRYPVDPNGLPIHGAMPGAMRWELVEVVPDRLTATLVWDGPELLSLFPFRHHVEVEACVHDRGLTLVTSVHADGGDEEHLELDERMIPTGTRTPLAPRDFLLADRSLDDGLAGLTEPAQFLVSDGERALSAVFGDGYGWAQVYAPPGRNFICFEPMTAPTDALRSGNGLTVLGPGDSYRAAVEFTVIP